MQDLKDVTRETHYENYRAQCIQSMTRMVVQEKKRRWVEAHRHSLIKYLSLQFLIYGCCKFNRRTDKYLQTPIFTLYTFAYRMGRMWFQNIVCFIFTDIFKEIKELT